MHSLQNSTGKIYIAPFCDHRKHTIMIKDYDGHIVMITADEKKVTWLPTLREVTYTSESS